jgi:hypothetical protein
MAILPDLADDNYLERLTPAAGLRLVVGFL